MSLTLASDCRHYRGDKPCRPNRRCRCSCYERMGFRVLIIKTGALGDVVRTTCLLPTLKRHYQPSHVTWVTRTNGVRILKDHPLIDRLMPFDSEGLLALTQQRFDLVLSLDKEPGPAAFCNAVVADDKRGIGLSPWGTPVPCNPECESYFELGLDDSLKFQVNRRTYPELIHAAVGLPYVREPYRIYCDESALSRARSMFDPWRVKGAGPVIGLNTGAGTTFANKAPRPAWWVELARSLAARGFTVVLLGGPEEARTNGWIQERLGHQVHGTGNDNSESQFVAVVDRCDAVITGDTLALHVAIGRGIPVVALFGPTCEQEVDLFDLGRKIISPASCGPCYRGRCEKQSTCMDLITVDEVVDAVETVCTTRKPALLSAS